MMKKVFNWVKAASPIISIVSLAGCVVLSVVCINMNGKIKETKQTIKETKDAINNYAEEPHFSQGNGEKSFTLLEIINDLYVRQDRIQRNQSNIQYDLDRSNRFLDDYNTARLSDDDWPMKWSY